MKAKPRIAREVASSCSDDGFYIDHASLSDPDVEWLANAQRLILWNVKIPLGFLARLPKLWWLDLRGGSGMNLAALLGAKSLEFLEVNQVRGMHDLSAIAELESLRYLFLYGLPKVKSLPSCAELSKLERASLGQMKGLASLDGLLKAPHLRELEFMKTVRVSPPDVENIRNHRSLKLFAWAPEDVPISVREPVIKRIGLPELSRGEWPENWFAKRGRGTGRPVYVGTPKSPA